MSFRGLILSVPTAFPTTNGKAMNIMIHPTIQKRRLGFGFRCWCWVVALLLPYGSTGCARVTPLSEPTPTDLQVTADSLKAAVREAQRTAAELRTELDEQRKELADAQVARAQLQGMLQETERRLADARQIIDLQREELSAARTERERVAQAVQPPHHPTRQSTKAGLSRGKSLSSIPEGIAETLPKIESATEHPPAMDETPASSQTFLSEAEAGTIVAPVAQSTALSTPTGEPHVKTIVVRNGDTLWTIARRHKVGVNALRSLNGVSGDLIMVGRTLRVPEPKRQQAAIQPVSTGAVSQ